MGYVTPTSSMQAAKPFFAIIWVVQQKHQEHLKKIL